MSIPSFSIKKEYTLITCFALIYCIALILAFGFNYQRWTDEEHFYFTILEFIKNPNLYTLKHYEEMSTPIPFIVYGVWGWSFDSSLSTLRILSLFISFATILSAFHLFKIAKLSFISSCVCILILTLNPYFIGVSFFVYTDLLCELCLIWVFIFTLQQKTLAACIWLLLAILCRQYMIFFIPAMAVWLFAQEKFSINFTLIKRGLLLLIPTIGVLALFVFWGGASPANELKTLYVHQAFSLHGDAFTAYMAASMLYTFPLLFLFMKEIKKVHFYIVLPVAIVWYYIFPVQGSQVAIESIIHIDTIGIVHKLTHVLPTYIEYTIWFFLFISSCFVFAIVIEKAIKKPSSTTFLVACSWLFFLLIMCLSYLTWEKYLLPILPLLLVLAGQQLDHIRLKNLN